MTVDKGVIAWDDFAGRMLYGITQEGKHQYLRDLARNSLRGAIRRVQEGKWPGGRPPFGYAIGDDGHLKPGDPEGIATVRRVFALRLRGFGYRVIARQLNNEGVPSPSAPRRWSHDAVRVILNREAYCGVVTIGLTQQGKYFVVDDDRATPVDGTKRRKPTRAEKAHEPLIDRETFDRVQMMRTFAPKPHCRPGSEGAPLAGLLYCGRCGHVMYAQSLQRKSGQKSPNYICGRYHKRGECGYCAVPQQGIHTAVANAIRDTVLMGSRERLEAAIADELKKNQPASADREIAALRKRLAATETKIENAMERLVTVDDSLVQALEQKLLKLQSKRTRTQSQLKAAQRPVEQRDPKQVANRIWQLDRILVDGSPSRVRQAMSEIADRITLNFEKGAKTKRGQSYKFVGGTIDLKPPKQWAYTRQGQWPSGLCNLAISRPRESC